MDKSKQLDLLRDQQAESVQGVIRSVSTDLGVFGNRTDIIVLGDSTWGVSLLECSNPDVNYYSQSSAYPEDIL